MKIGTGDTLSAASRELNEEPDSCRYFYAVHNFRDDHCTGSGRHSKRSADGRVHVVLQLAGEDMDARPDPSPGRMIAPEPGRNRTLIELGSASIGRIACRPFHPVTTHAIQFSAQHCVPSVRICDPGPIDERRPVADMLSVSAVEVGNPVAFPVELKSGD